jgi:hypothetical protein
VTAFVQKYGLQRCFTRGVPLWIIRMHELMQPALHYVNTQAVVQDYDSLRRVYYRSLNAELVHLVDSLITIDQWHTDRVNNGFVLLRPFYWMGWVRNNKRQFKILKPVIEKYGYPGEYLVGLPERELDSATNYKNKHFWGPLLFEDRAEIMLIHYFSQPRDDINALLYPSMIKGYLPSDQYSNLNDFLAEWGRRKYRRKTYYNTWHWDPDTLHIPVIDLRRDSIGLNTFAQQQRNVSVNRERRKNKAMNASILLE